MDIKIGELSIPTSGLTSKCHTDVIELPYFYNEIFGEFPVYRCNFNVTKDESDEVDVYNKIYNELVNTGDFIPIKYEYDYNENAENIVSDNYMLISQKKSVGVQFEYGGLTVMTHKNPQIINDIIEKYLKKYRDNSQEAKCYIIVKEHDFYLKNFTVRLDGDLDFDLYNEEFKEVHENMVKSIKEDKNGLYLLYGAPGTGKTTYIRHLIKECETEKREFIYVPSNLFGDFTNPSLIPFLMDHRGCVFIIEDCESLVTVENGVRSGELTDLLNMTDGLLADALDIKIICTFNIDDGKIDDALLRPGRCRCRYEFELLDKERANKVAEKLGLNKVEEDTSLADLFNNGKSFVEKKKKMGFR